MAVIEVDSLVQDYGHGRGVFGISFEVEKGQVFGFLGPNGAGKSTTIRHIMGFSRPQKGETRVFGKESFSCYDQIMARVGYLPGEIALPDGLNGWEFIEMMDNLRKVQNKERLNTLLKRFDLNPSMDTKRMSLGEKRKLAIVTAFMHDPEVLILDEPTSGLDPLMQQVFIDFILEEKARGKTILLSSHIFSEIEATCDHIAIIKEGKIVSSFDINDIKRNENKIFKIGFVDQKESKVFLSSFRGAWLGEDGLTYMPVHDSEINLLTRELANRKILSFEQVPYTLEDHFMGFYKEEGKNGK